jgi:hypothetical protein
VGALGAGAGVAGADVEVLSLVVVEFDSLLVVELDAVVPLLPL